ncbi:hypothetical protein LIER_26739 [Lithospermum erythrorhizon]|uniref:Uncharacterized protein n=1 Tax=Lithospermum erythrorhizon TaxID=34254 RepID=A0AAV3R9G2_LITER
MSQSLENPMDNYELHPRNNPNHTECSRAGEMSLLLVAAQTTQEPTLHATQAPPNQVARGSVPLTAPVIAERAEAAYQVDKIRSALPQGTKTTHRLPWFTFVEVMLVLGGLVYDKEFDLEAKDDPPTWGTDLYLVIISSTVF